MDYYGFTEEQFDRIITLLNKISVTSMEQIDAFHEATLILRKPFRINVAQEGVKEDGESICKD